MNRKVDQRAEILTVPSNNYRWSRRQFVQGLAIGGAGTALMSLARPVWALNAVGQSSILTGTDFNLEVSSLPVNFTGSPATAIAVNGTLPGPQLRMREGDSVTLRVTNQLSQPTAIHWHGLILPAEMDGVPGISYPGIAPGETFTYRFKVRQNGTFWYHAHTLQEQAGLFGTIVIEPRDLDPIQSHRDYVVMLSDWTDEDPLAIYVKLKKQSNYYNFHQPQAGEFFRDVSAIGLAKAVEKRRAWNAGRMNPTDLSDVSGHTYTYLMNGTTAAGNWTAIFQPGERVRLRFVGAGMATLFDVRIPGLKLTVVATDGQRIEPVEVDEFRIAPGETYDVIVEPRENRAFTIFAQSMDRTGFARGTLAPSAGLQSEVPAVDRLAWLSPDDMMGAMAQMSVADNSMPGMDMPATAAVKAHHARSEYGAAVDMRVDNPRTNLDDPGIGLRGNGRRVLTYADLRTIGGALDKRAPGREIELHLTGNMDHFIWSIDGVKLSDAKPIHFAAGERLRVVLVNDTMMTHPMHLHGMWSEMESPDGEFQVRKHTISVQPAQRVSFAVTADAPGRWAFHCHLLYHMAAGMFREVVVA